MRRRNGARRRDLVHRPDHVPLDRRPPLGALQRRLAHGLAQFVAALVKIFPEFLLRDEAVEVAVELEEQLSDGGLVDAGTGEQLLEGRVRDRILEWVPRASSIQTTHDLRHAEHRPTRPAGFSSCTRPTIFAGADGVAPEGNGLEDDGASTQLGAVAHGYSEPRAARAPSGTCLPIFGCLSPWSLREPPKVTPCNKVQRSPRRPAVSPIRRPSRGR